MTTENKYFNMLSKADFFGSALTFTHEKSKHVQTCLGGIFSIILLSIVVLLIVGFGQDFFKRINPSLVSETVHPEDYNKYIINNKNFSVSLRLENSQGAPFRDDQAFEIIMDYFYMNLTESGEWDLGKYENLKLNKCTEHDFADKKEFLGKKLGNFLCPNISNITVGGFWDTSFYGFLVIRVERCAENSFNRKGEMCKSSNTTLQMLNEQIQLSLAIQYVSYSTSNYENPFKTYLNNNFIILDPNLFKSITYYFKEFRVLSDYGWILTDSKEVFGLGLSDISLDVISQNVLTPPYDNLYSRVTFNFMKEISNNKREYPKIQNLAAQVGGILKIFLMAGSLMVNYYNANTLELQLLNSLSLYNNKLILISKDIDRNNGNNESNLEFSNIKQSNISNNRKSSTHLKSDNNTYLSDDKKIKNNNYNSDVPKSFSHIELAKFDKVNSSKRELKNEQHINNHIKDENSSLEYYDEIDNNNSKSGIKNIIEDNIKKESNNQENKSSNDIKKLGNENNLELNYFDNFAIHLNKNLSSIHLLSKSNLLSLESGKEYDSKPIEHLTVWDYIKIKHKKGEEKPNYNFDKLKDYMELKNLMRLHYKFNLMSKFLFNLEQNKTLFGDD